MLKFRLTWLQPSLSMLGIALILSNPIYAFAAQKPAKVATTSKTPAKYVKWTIANSINVATDRELQLAGIAPTPDVAIRQLADNAVAPSNRKVVKLSAKTKLSRQATLVSSIGPSKRLANTSKATKLKPSKNEIAAILSRAADPSLSTPVPGIFIGNIDPQVALKSRATRQPLAALPSGSEIGAPTPLSSMMAASKVVDPYPVVRPELMEKLNTASGIAKVPAISKPNYAINPVATIPARPIAKAPQAIVPAAAIPTKLRPAAVHSLDPIAVIPSKLQKTRTKSLDPIAAIPSGLQRLLGNNLNSGTSVASKSVIKTNTTNNSLLALKQLVAPAPKLSNGVSLQLATAQAYASVPKFDIPGERVAAVFATKPATRLVASVNARKQSIVKSIESKPTQFVLASDSRQQNWTAVVPRNNLGGLILGSQPAMNAKTIGLLPVNNEVVTPMSNGLPALNSGNVQ
jgi:hypothetical protein